MLRPNDKVPNLEVPLINDTRWSLEAQESEKFTMLVFYRGLHCPICKKYLEELATRLDEFEKRGVHLIAISGDTEEKAKKAGKDWNIKELPVGYNLAEETAREWGLFISKGISDKEPDVFSEPALFLLRPDRSLYASAIQNMPFARPHWEDILNAMDFVDNNEYPARGGA